MLPPGGGAPPGGAGPAAPPTPERPSRSRRVVPVLGIVVVLLLAVAGGAVGLQQRTIAADWRDRSLALETQRDDAIGRTEALQRQLDEVAGSLDVSEGDVASLEERVRELADEVAQAEDVAATTGVERDTLEALSSAVAGSITSLDSCVSELFDLLDRTIDAFNRQGEGEQVAVGPLNQQRTSATDSCNDARADAASASSDAQRLLP